MLFLCDIHFILCRGEEHRSLQLSQVQLVCSPDGQEHLIYTENLLKNNQGGLKHRKIKPKQDSWYNNKENPIKRR